MTILAELLPNINELFQWKGIVSEHTILEFNKNALMAFVSPRIASRIIWLSASTIFH